MSFFYSRLYIHRQMAFASQQTSLDIMLHQGVLQPFDLFITDDSMGCRIHQRVPIDAMMYRLGWIEHGFRFIRMPFECGK
jgi:hypothetical protein